MKIYVGVGGVGNNMVKLASDNGFYCEKAEERRYICIKDIEDSKVYSSRDLTVQIEEEESPFGLMKTGNIIIKQRDFINVFYDIKIQEESLELIFVTTTFGMFGGEYVLPIADRLAEKFKSKSPASEIKISIIAVALQHFRDIFPEEQYRLYEQNEKRFLERYKGDLCGISKRTGIPKKLYHIYDQEAYQEDLYTVLEGTEDAWEKINLFDPDKIVFTREEAKNVLQKRQDRVLKVPEGMTVLEENFAALVNSMFDTYCFFEIIIPKSVKEISQILIAEIISENTPVQCFEEITVDKENEFFTSVDGVLFSKDMKRLISYPSGKSGEAYHIPEGVEVINKYAFAYNVNLKRITFSDTVRRIEDYAFTECKSLINIELNRELEQMGEHVFYASNIPRIVFPEGLKNVHYTNFSSKQVGTHVIEVKSKEISINTKGFNLLGQPHFMPPVILVNQNSAMEKYARRYDLNYFNGFYMDEKEIIWSEDGKTLIDFPAHYQEKMYILPENAEQIFRWAFNNSDIEHVVISKDVAIVGDTHGTDYSRISSEDEPDFIVEEKKEMIELDSSQFEETKYVFISYSSKNQEKADAFRQCLQENGIACWMAPYDIPAGSKYAYVINDALEKCSCLALLLSKKSQESEYVEREVDIAISCSKPIITVQLENMVLNSGFKFYVGNSQIVPVREIDQNTEEIKKVIRGIRAFLG